MMNIDFILNTIDKVTNQMLAQDFTKLSEAVQPIIGSAFLLYCVWQAYKMFHQQDKFFPMVVIHNAVVLAFISMVAFSTPFFNQHVVPIVTHVGDDLASKLIETKDSESNASSLQKLSDKIIEQRTQMNKMAMKGFSVYDGKTWDNWILLEIMSIISLIIGFIFLAFALFYLCVAKIMISVVLVCTPIFVSLALFPATRQYFSLYCNQLMNYSLLTLMYPIVFTLFLTMIDQLTFDNLEQHTLSNISLFIVTYILAFLTTMQVPQLTSSLSGGVGLNGLVGSARQGMKDLTEFSGGAIAKTIAAKGNIGKGMTGFANTLLGKNQINK